MCFLWKKEIKTSFVRACIWVQNSNKLFNGAAFSFFIIDGNGIVRVIMILNVLEFSSLEDNQTFVFMNEGFPSLNLMHQVFYYLLFSMHLIRGMKYDMISIFC